MVSPSNTTDTTKSTDANIGSNSTNPGSTDATTGFTQINSESSTTEVNAISTDAVSVSTGITMGSTEPGAGSTNINTEPTAANTSSTEANTESTVSEISSTQASTESTVATTTVNPVLSLAEILNTTSAVCIRNVQAGYLFTNGSTRDSDRRYVYVGNEITPESRWTLEPAQDGTDSHIYIKSSRDEYWYTSIYEKNTFNMANQNSFENCPSEGDVTSGGICRNQARMTFTYIPGGTDSDAIFDIIQASNNEFKIRNTRYNRFQYASNGDVTSVVAGANAPDENLLWTFERC